MTPLKTTTCIITILQTSQINNTIFCDISFNDMLLYKGIQNANFPVPYGTYKAQEDKHGTNGASISWLGVPHHIGIEIHIANHAHELRGCTAIGHSYVGEMLIKSKQAMLSLLAKVSLYDSCFIIFKRSVNFVDHTPNAIS